MQRTGRLGTSFPRPRLTSAFVRESASSTLGETTSLSLACGHPEAWSPSHGTHGLAEIWPRQVAPAFPNFQLGLRSRPRAFQAGDEGVEASLSLSRLTRGASSSSSSALDVTIDTVPDDRPRYARKLRLARWRRWQSRCCSSFRDATKPFVRVRSVGLQR